MQVAEFKEMSDEQVRLAMQYAAGQLTDVQFNYQIVTKGLDKEEMLTAVKLIRAKANNVVILTFCFLALIVLLSIAWIWSLFS